MSAKANYFKIGIFVIAAAVIAIIAIIVLGAGSIFQHKIMLETYIDGSVQGLDVGSPFKLRGVKLGSVEEITFVANEYKFERTSKEYFAYGHFILIKASVEPSHDVSDKEQRILIERMITKGLRVRLASQGITGAAFLEADYIDPEEFPPMEIKWEPNTYYVPSVPSKITQLTESVKTILEKLEEINVKGITDGLEETMSSVNRILDEVKMAKLTKQAGQLLAEVRETNKKIKPLITDASETMDSVTEELPDILAQLKRTLRRFNNFVSNEEENVAVSTENMRLITENLRDLTESAKKSPSQLIFAGPPPRSNPGGRQ
ncbi:MAG: ABC transporter substrate-binding protein [Candidatus Brocadiaceae bacterium]|nr:ABC transporter substrate-binding protein [Candidatus Brocadiaceae bacterium]